MREGLYYILMGACLLGGFSHLIVAVPCFLGALFSDAHPGLNAFTSSLNAYDKNYWEPFGLGALGVMSPFVSLLSLGIWGILIRLFEDAIKGKDIPDE